MEKQVFAATDGAPAVGPYSPAVGAGDFVFISGQIALDPDGKIVKAFGGFVQMETLESEIVKLLRR